MWPSKVCWCFTSSLWTCIRWFSLIKGEINADRVSGMWEAVRAVCSDLRSSSSPISTPASRSMATPSVYSSLRVGSRNLKGSLGNCLFTVWISVWKLMQRNTHTNTHSLKPTRQGSGFLPTPSQVPDYCAFGSQPDRGQSHTLVSKLQENILVLKQFLTVLHHIWISGIISSGSHALLL